MGMRDDYDGGLIQWFLDFVGKGGVVKSFLKKLGAALANFAKSDIPALAAVGAIVTPFLGSGKVAQAVSTGVNDLVAIGQQAVTVEVAMQGQPGPAKLAALIALVGPILKTSELVAGKKIADEALFTKATQGIAQGAVDLLQSLHEDSVPS